MTLNEMQKAEVAEYIASFTSYRETLNEVQDHVLSALAEEEERSYSLELVDCILSEDLGGVSEIKLAEETYRSELHSHLPRLLWREAKRSFRFPRITENILILVLCILLYFSSPAGETKNQVLGLTLMALMVVPLLLYGLKAITIEKGQTKPSIKDGALRHCAMLGLNLASVVALLFIVRKPLLPLAPDIVWMILLSVYFILGVYIRAFLRVYHATIIENLARSR